ncbi:MAG TPA: DUF2617 family protein [Gemmataceae bacterium]|jgi:hypothetical protein|nr:DUF2617 family protein [Gemmataceae bacterium]
MTSLAQRPPADAMSVHLFRRPIHPELIETLASREVRQDDYVLTVRITPAGHAISWQSGNVFLTELTAARGQPLPGRGHVWRHRFEGEHTDAFRASPIFCYQMSAQAETLPFPLFSRVHEELLADGRKRGLLHLLEPQHRCALAPLGLVTADGRAGCLVINTFHTFPADCTLLKTQTLIERVSP